MVAFCRGRMDARHVSLCLSEPRASHNRIAIFARSPRRLDAYSKPQLTDFFFDAFAAFACGPSIFHRDLALTFGVGNVALGISDEALLIGDLAGVHVPHAIPKKLHRQRRFPIEPRAFLRSSAAGFWR